MEIKDLYVSKDWEDGYKIGLRDGKLSIKRKVEKRRGSNKPITIDEHTWYYEEKNKISLVHEIYHKGVYLRTDIITIKPCLVPQGM